MRVANLLCLSIGLILAVAGAGRPQDEKPTDYTSKSLGKWIEALRDDDLELRAQARKALGPDGPYAKVAVPALIDAFGHKGPSVGPEAARALADYGPSVVPSLARALKRPEAPVRERVVEALGY